MLRRSGKRVIARGSRTAAGRVLAGGLALVLTLGVAACGSGGSHGSHGSRGSGGSKAAAAAAASNGVAARSPAQIVAAAQSALRAANGFVLAGDLRQAGKTLRLQVVDGGTAKLQVTLSQSGRSAEIITLPGANYIKANQAFWSTQAGPKAAILADRWFEIPASASRQLTSGFGEFAPRTLARCLGEDLGRLSRGGTTTVGGRPAVVVRQAGNVPGSTPGTLAVATTGPAYPLRVTSTGPTRGGGKVDVCNTGQPNDTEGTITLNDFGHAPAITAPKHATATGAPSGPSI